ncbi:hypothetical protein L2449_10670 [Mesorhizobium muleiense]|nr:hypothetical protein [Mesorhizobium muleiense]MCF6117367.1 hypothetical protein [Mesorhizobium muleiense]
MKPQEAKTPAARLQLPQSIDECAMDARWLLPAFNNERDPDFSFEQIYTPLPAWPNGSTSSRSHLINAACVFSDHFAEAVALDSHFLSGFDLVVELDQMLDKPALGQVRKAR